MPRATERSNGRAQQGFHVDLTLPLTGGSCGDVAVSYHVAPQGPECIIGEGVGGQGGGGVVGVATGDKDERE
ncbi:unnamed protein product [Lampetra fluviatilis]